MSTRECERDKCIRPVSDAAVCSTCMGDASKALTNVGWLADELDLAISQQTRFTALSAPVKGTAETPSPFGVQAGLARDTLRNVLIGWTKIYADTAKANYPPDSLTAMALFLQPRVEWFRHHTLALDFLEEITGAVRRCHAAVDVPSRSGIPVGPCIEADAAGVPCPGEVKAYLPWRDDEPAHMDCGACGKVWPPAEWRRAGARIKAKIGAVA